jgi:hypothetical protein
VYGVQDIWGAERRFFALAAPNSIDRPYYLCYIEPEKAYCEMRRPMEQRAADVLLALTRLILSGAGPGYDRRRIFSVKISLHINHFFHLTETYGQTYETRERVSRRKLLLSGDLPADNDVE